MNIESPKCGTPMNATNLETFHYTTENECRARKTDSMRKAIGVDLYNQSLTGKVAKTLNAIKSDADHVPCVITNATSLETFHCTTETERCQSIKARDYKDPLVVVYEMQRDESELLL